MTDEQPDQLSVVARLAANFLLPRGRTVLSRDDRPIKVISWDDADGSAFMVGSQGTTDIIAYDEIGEMAMVPWVAVIKDGAIIARAPAYQVTVGYFPVVDEMDRKF